MDQRQNCSSIRDLLRAFIDARIEVTAASDHCVVTLPLTTLDDRLIDVFVKETGTDHLVVSDGGKSMAELYTQGVHLNDTQNGYMKTIARQYNAVFMNNSFHTACKKSELEAAIVAIAQCAALAMVPLAGHRPIVEDEPVSARVARALQAWKPDYVDIRKRQSVRGQQSDHIFDFVTFARKADASTVAIKLLPPSYGPHVQARQYGYLVYDLRGRMVDDWNRLAIISKREEWPTDDVDLIRSMSTDVIELETDHEDRIEAILPRKMTELTEAA